MINGNELVRSREIASRSQAQHLAERAPLSPTDVRKTIEHRLGMLRSLRHEVSASLYDALHAKIVHEEASFVAIIESEEHEREAKRQMDKTLQAEYFVQKTLPSHIF